jgi:hypothetical protein
MAELVIPLSYKPLPPQAALRESKAVVRGF